MNYIYDIVLNYQNYYYQFYEWKRKDKIKNIYKIPIYRVSDKDILILKNNNVKVDKIFINKVKEANKKYKKNMCLVSNTKITIGLLFDDNGVLLKRSSLIFDEEEEANDISKDLNQIKINYLENKETLKKDNLRFIIERKEKIKNLIDKTNNLSVLRYLFYEYYHKENNDINKIKKTLKKEIENNWNKNINKLYNLTKILEKKIYL